MENQLSIFDILYPKYKITKPIKMITLFSGYDSQCLALKYLGVSYEHWKTCEWAVKSIQALKDIHFESDNTDYSKKLTTEQVKDYLFNKGISSNYNEPMTGQQINRLNEKQARTIYNNIKATHNLVNIQQVKGKDLEITDTDKYEYIMTYSFPCQDLSLAGKGKGMSDTSTRSGMLWEVERILTELKETNSLPQCLIMENVPQVHGEGNVEDFNKWQLRLEELGYKNYWQDLIATDYGIPQTRNRCFMVSILGDYNYTFPKPIPLKLKLKDMLEDNVDEKYYLSDKMINYLTNSVSSGGIDRSDSFNRIQEKIEKEGVAATITTNAGNRATDNFIKVKNNTKKGYLEATDGDGIDLAMPNSETRRGRVQKNSIQTLTTQNNLGVCIGTYQYAKSDNFMHGKDRFEENKGTFPTLRTTPKEGIVNSDLRIRKLTPRECGRLQGVKDSDIDKLLSNQSDSSAYHCFGDSITCTVLCAIFGELLDIDYKSLIERWNYNE